MIDKLASLSLEEIKNGYFYDGQTNTYICNICSKGFEQGEIFESEGRFFEARKMVQLHMQKEHPDLFDLLAAYDKKYTGITENQKTLLKMIYEGMTDQEIAKKMGVAPATVRHQRFVFREKAKQAKLFLGIYELAIERRENEEMIDIHKGAKMVDDRYFVTKEEEEKILSTMFASLSPLRLKTFSAKEKKKIVILRKIAQQFEKETHYEEKELNRILKEIYEDFATIRRYLLEYGFMERTNDCKEYWLK